MSAEISRIRKVWLTTIAMEIAAFMLAGCAWFFFFSDRLHAWWLLLFVLPVHFLLHERRKQICNCPHCKQSLLGFDGDEIFSHACPHCGKDLK